MIHFHHKRPDLFNFVAELLDIHTTPVGQDPTGEVSDGYLRLHGHLRPNVRKVSSPVSECVRTARTGQQEWLDVGYVDGEDRSLENTCFFLIAFGRDYPSSRILQLLGLILEPVDLEASKYRRVCMFAHK